MVCEKIKSSKNLFNIINNRNAYIDFLELMSIKELSTMKTESRTTRNHGNDWEFLKLTESIE